jgi:hypothetical protein
MLLAGADNVPFDTDGILVGCVGARVTAVLEASVFTSTGLDAVALVPFG